MSEMERHAGGSSAVIARTHIRQCPICGGQSDALGITVDYGVPALGARIPISFAACRACAFAFQQDPVRDDQMERYYRASPRYRSEVVDKTEAALGAAQVAFMEATGPVGNGPSVLDIGADMGKLLDRLHARGCQTAFMESNEKAIEYLSSHGRHRRIEELRPDDRFDLVVLSQVYEHIVDPVVFMRSLRDHLSARGRVFIEVPCHTNWDDAEYGLSFEHVNYFSTYALGCALHRAGYYIARMEVSADDRYFGGRVRIIRAIARPVASGTERDLIAAIRNHHAAGMTGRVAAARGLAEKCRRTGHGGLGLYGAGELADMILSDPELHHTAIAAIFDTDAQKHGRAFHGLSIKGPREIPATGCSAILILSGATAAIRKTIEDSGFAGEVVAWCDLEASQET